MPASELLVAQNLGTDLQTPSRVGPRTFCASTQTPPNGLGSEELRLNRKKAESWARGQPSVPAALRPLGAFRALIGPPDTLVETPPLQSGDAASAAQFVNDSGDFGFKPAPHLGYV